MDEKEQQVMAKFKAAFDDDDRKTIARHLVKQALVEIPCSECGAAVFVLKLCDGAASYECPLCHKRTFAKCDGARVTTLSERRLLRIVGYARSKRWYCADHDGVAVEVAAVEQDPADPVSATVHFICRRPSGWLKPRKRSHSGSKRISILSLEAEMLAAEVATG